MIPPAVISHETPDVQLRLEFYTDMLSSKKWVRNNLNFVTCINNVCTFLFMTNRDI